MRETGRACAGRAGAGGADAAEAGGGVGAAGGAAGIAGAGADAATAGAGAAILTNDDGVLAGYLTDGDLRRHLLLATDSNSLLQSRAEEHMTRSPLALRSEMAALDALRLLQERKLNDAPVVDESNRPVGWLEDQELLRAGLM